MNIELIICIVSVIGSATAVLLSARKHPYEARNLDAVAAKAYAEASNLMAERAKELAAEFELYKAEVEAEIRNLHNELRIVKTALKESRETNQDLREWAESLVCQLKENHIEPVKMRMRV